MIRVTIEMVPYGIEEEKYPMHVIEITNDAKTTLANRSKGSYNVRVSRKMTGDKVTWLKTGRVENFPRKSKNAVHLLLAALQSVVK